MAKATQTLKDQVLRLKQGGKRPDQIIEILPVSRATVFRYLRDAQVQAVEAIAPSNSTTGGTAA